MITDEESCTNSEGIIQLFNTEIMLGFKDSTFEIKRYEKILWV